MRILKTKYYLHKLGDGTPGNRPRLIINVQFDTLSAAGDFQKAHRIECAGYVPDSGRYILSLVVSVQRAKFVEVKNDATI